MGPWCIERGGSHKASWDSPGREPRLTGYRVCTPKRGKFLVRGQAMLFFSFSSSTFQLLFTKCICLSLGVCCMVVRMQSQKKKPTLYCVWRAGSLEYVFSSRLDAFCISVMARNHAAGSLSVRSRLGLHTESIAASADSEERFTFRTRVSGGGRLVSVCFLDDNMLVSAPSSSLSGARLWGTQIRGGLEVGLAMLCFLFSRQHGWSMKPGR